MRRQRRPKRTQNHERWLITYSDLITLLLVFFIIMFAMSNVDKVRFASLAQSLQAALHDTKQQIPLSGLGQSSLLESGAQNNGTTMSDVFNSTKTQQNQQKAKQAQEQQQLKNLYAQVNQYIQAHHLQNQVHIYNQQRGVQITMNDVALFDTGQAVLRPEAIKLLTGFVPFFKSLSNNIVVEGYTDNQPIKTSIYPSNWELSAARAMSVVHVLSNDGVDPSRLSGTGYGQYHNIAPNDTPAHRQENRRVNIVILKNNLNPGSSAAMPGN